MSPVDNDLPPAGEEIHLPGPTIQPLLVTLGITMILVGLTFRWYLVVAGVILTVAVIIRWTIDTKRDIDHLPLDHSSH
jgi:hypothetical protein